MDLEKKKMETEVRSLKLHKVEIGNIIFTLTLYLINFQLFM